ncbi:hypothetical protein CR513_21614, partial [Mucuna pruriens]
MSFIVVFHHMRCFVKSPNLHYEGMEVHAINNVDVDRWSYFEVLSIVRDLYYKGNVNIQVCNNHTFKLKTLFLTHSYGIVFNNKNAKEK